MKKLSDKLYCLPEETADSFPDCHVYVLGTKTSFYLCDAGNGTHSVKKIKTLVDNGFLLEYCKGIIFTHLHFDHIRGSLDFKKPTYMHEDDASLLQQNDDSPFGFEGMKKMASAMGHDTTMPLIDYLLYDGDIITIADQRWEVIHTPGHTPGSICLYNKAIKTVLSGDTIFYNSIGRTDLIGSDSTKMKESLERLEILELIMILPGHGTLVLGVEEEYIMNLKEKFFG